MFVDELGTADRLLSIAGGVLLLFVGVAMLSSHLVRPLAAISSPIGRWAAFVFTVSCGRSGCCRTGSCDTGRGARAGLLDASGHSSAARC